MTPQLKIFFTRFTSFNVTLIWVIEVYVKKKTCFFGDECGSNFGEVLQLDSYEMFDELTSKNICIVNFSARWCPPSRTIEPLEKELAKKYPQICFIHVETENFRVTFYCCCHFFIFVFVCLCVCVCILVYIDDC